MCTTYAPLLRPLCHGAYVDERYCGEIVARPRLKALLGLLSHIHHLSLNTMAIALHDFDSKVLPSVVDHVFLPPKLPQRAPTEEAERETNVALCHILIQAARAFSQGLSPSQQLLWAHMIKMMESMHWAAKGPLVESELKVTFSNLAVGGGFRLLPAYNIIVYLYFQMSSLCMFELRTPLSLFACLMIVFDSRCSKSLHKQAK